MNQLRETPSILITGANGFIGRRLLTALTDQGHLVRALARQPLQDLPAGATGVVGDLRKPESLVAALTGIETAYFLVHALGEPDGNLAAQEEKMAGHFATAAEAAGVRRVIYLAGLGDPARRLSDHLASRRRVEEALADRSYQLTVLRAAIIIGAGGASYEMIRFLVKTQPVLLAPHFLEAKVQPIAVTDVIAYLVGCLDRAQTAGQRYDIGGPEVMTYHQLLERFAAAIGEVNLFLPTPVFFPGVLARMIDLFTTVERPVAKALLEGLDIDVICRETEIRKVLPRSLVPLEEAVRIAAMETESA